MPEWYAFLILFVGLAVVIGGIVALRVHAFLALITAAVVVSLMAPGEWVDKIPRVAEAFGSTAAGVGVVIALAAIIGGAMTASGAADRVVRMFIDLFGERRGGTALMASGFAIAIPVFFDTVFYLLVPLARSMHRRTGGCYVKYLIAAAASASAHALVPPTPGPLLVANELGVDIGLMMLVGIAVAIPASIVGLMFGSWSDKRMTVAPPAETESTGRHAADDAVYAEIAGDDELPSLAWSLAPIVLPVCLITANTVANAVQLDLPEPAANALAVLGTPNLALLLAAILALVTQQMYRQQSLATIANSVEHALMSGGVIVLITAAGGAFGGMLREAQLAPAIKTAFGETAASGIGLLLLAFAMASLIKFAQGSSTAAMIVTSGMVAAMIQGTSLGYHPVYLCTSIGAGSLVGSWMNDSGFWIFAKMGGLTELQTLRTWTPLLAILGVVAMIMTLLLATAMPMAPPAIP
ncbi:Low-affinity gluconate transporter [Posidoniimonas corsicana]|uniref:Low-affinity gluconate transporter n=1 Tax=Posidoniimonas corsicana TaxID=1938618 RepID=A0A5C5VAC5_9BACT|nr:Low-affinity gluconate transporter [Posidoniimonas corsicana]